MTAQVLLLAAALVVLAAATPVLVGRPARTILPLYAGTLPVASVIEVSVPLPSPFDTLSSVLGGVAILACVAHLVLHRGGRVPPVPVALWAAFMAWIILTSFWAVDGQRAIDVLLVAVPLIVLMALVSMLRIERRDLDLLRTALILSGIGVGLYALFLLLTGGGLPAHGVSQRFSVAGGPERSNPNILAASLLLPLAMSVERFFLGGTTWRGPRAWRRLGLAGALFTSLAILLTGSRGGLFSAVVVFVLVVIRCRRLPRSLPFIRRALATAGLLFLATLALVMLGPGAGEGPVRGLEPIQRFAQADGGSGRVDIWQGGLSACRNHCAWGAGLGNFEPVFGDALIFSGAARNVGLARPPHNILLGLAVETGVAGLTLFAVAMGVELLRLFGRRMLAVAPGLGPALVGVLVANLFLSEIWYKYLWLVIIAARYADAVSPPVGDPQPGPERALPAPVR
jgi:O-antigen ligase